MDAVPGSRIFGQQPAWSLMSDQFRMKIKHQWALMDDRQGFS
jgi:hypothetical protein